jgi:predicted acylesterase/phospholipase RssA
MDPIAPDQVLGTLEQLLATTETSDKGLRHKVLALSGGGFRATLFHLGVVRFLADAGLLAQVTDITAVSGGSILGAHLGLHWGKYTAGGTEFDGAAEELLDFIRLDIRNRIVCLIAACGGLLALIAFLLIGRFNLMAPGWAILAALVTGMLGIFAIDCLAGLRIRLLVSHYRSLYRRNTYKTKKLSEGAGILCTSAMLATLVPVIISFWYIPTWLAILLCVIWVGAFNYISEFLKEGWYVYEVFHLSHFGGLVTRGAQPPRVHLLATSLNHGLPCWFDQNGCHWYELDPIDRTKTVYRHAPTGQPEIAVAVAASSAFPPMFPPIRVTDDHLKLTDREFPRTLELTDGGVYDNAGLEILRCDLWKDKPIDLIIASDAEGRFDSQPSRTEYLFALPRNWRAIDILMKRVGDLAARYHAPTGRSKFLKVSIETSSLDKEKAGLDPRTQRSVGAIRTDFDRFSEGEIHVLTSHGYCVARQTYLQAGFSLEDSLRLKSEWSPVQDPTIREQAKKGTLELGHRLPRLLGLAWPRPLLSWWAGFFLVAAVIILGILLGSGNLPNPWFYPSAQAEIAD